MLHIDSRARKVGHRLHRRRFLTLAAAAAAVPYVTRRGFAASAARAAASTFLDAASVHEIGVAFDQSAYEAMIDVYASSGDKEWLEGTVTIDGETYGGAGLRLKGNSSLMGLRERGGGAMPGGTIRDPGGDLSADAPEGLPWLVRLDKYVDDQNHRGLTEFVIRSNPSETSLNEALALTLLADAGLASQAAAYAAFSVNGGKRALRLTIENPNDAWMAAHFSAAGLLYKSEATGDWSYRGDDPDAYNEVFDLEAGGTGDDADDLAPLIALLDFLNNSADDVFAAELPDRIDVEQLAVYLAMMDLLGNFDDIDGPGNNSYLYHAPDRGQFTIVPWDMNLAFGGMGMMIVAGEVPPVARAPEAMPGATGNNQTGPDRQRFPGGGPGGPRGMSNPLVERFTAVTDYAALVADRSRRLRAGLYDSGGAAAILTRWGDLLSSGAGDLVEAATIASESAAIAAFFTAEQ